MIIQFNEQALNERIQLNRERMEYGADYIIENVFGEENCDWPGDKEGRALLSFVSHYKINGYKIPCMDLLLAKMPEKANKYLYFGKESNEIIFEQQLSGHSWLLRGLCEHYEQFNDEFSLNAINSIVEYLYMPTAGRYKTYPIERNKENIGGVDGISLDIINGWLLSSDIGCAFMSIDGLSHAYKITKEPKYKSLVDEMIAVYSSIDKAALRAQTHCTLTAARGMIRMFEETNDSYYIDKAKEIYELYVNGGGMTYTYQNLNWWNRPDSWTEPCAIVDSIMLALMLYKVEKREEYRKTAARIYVNGFASAQRDNGGAGTDKLVCPDSGFDTLTAQDYEAAQCCTMRLAEGLWYISENKDLLYSETADKITKKSNGIYMCGDYIYAEISGGGERYAETVINVDGHKLSPLLKYYKLPKEVLLNTKQKIIF